MTKITAASITEAAVFIYSINWNLSIPITIKIILQIPANLIIIRRRIDNQIRIN